jgi:hypothetical protein
MRHHGSTRGVLASNLSGRADWKIPYKAGFIKVELLVQSRPEIGHMYDSTASSTPLLVPLNENIVVTIHAPGYREDKDDEPQRTVVNLLPGEIKKLHVPLQPLEAAK